MLKRLTLAFALLSSPALAQGNSYLIFPTADAALNRSAQECVARGCDGKHTIWWWPVIALTDGTYAVEIQAGTDQDVKGLTVQEQSALVTEDKMGALLPVAAP